MEIHSVGATLIYMRKDRRIDVKKLTGAFNVLSECACL